MHVEIISKASHIHNALVRTNKKKINTSPSSTILSSPCTLPMPTSELTTYFVCCRWNMPLFLVLSHPLFHVQVLEFLLNRQQNMRFSSKGILSRLHASRIWLNLRHPASVFDFWNHLDTFFLSEFTYFAMKRKKEYL